MPDFWNLNLSDYPNLGGEFPIGILVVLLFAGLILINLYLSLLQQAQGTLLTELLRRGATTPQRALSLSALHLAGSRSIRYALRHRSGEMKDLPMVYQGPDASKSPTQAQEDTTLAQENTLPAQDPATPAQEEARYYIPDHLLPTAERLRRRPCGWGHALLWTAVLCLLCVGLLLVLPALLALLNEWAATGA